MISSLFAHWEASVAQIWVALRLVCRMVVVDIHHHCHNHEARIHYFSSCQLIKAKQNILSKVVHI